ncbi:Tc1-like transposase DDE domain-containing protein [Methylorubrum extorquens]
MKAAREDWFANQDALNPDRLVFLDETAAATNMARRYGRAPRSERCRLAVPHGHVWTPPRVQAKSLDKALRVIGCCHVSGL